MTLEEKRNKFNLKYPPKSQVTFKTRMGNWGKAVITAKAIFFDGIVFAETTMGTIPIDWIYPELLIVKIDGFPIEVYSID